MGKAACGGSGEWGLECVGVGVCRGCILWGGAVFSGCGPVGVAAGGAAVYWGHGMWRA